MPAKRLLAEEAEGALGVTMVIMLPVMASYGSLILIDALSLLAHFRMIHP